MGGGGVTKERKDGNKHESTQNGGQGSGRARGWEVGARDPPLWTAALQKAGRILFLGL